MKTLISVLLVLITFGIFQSKAQCCGDKGKSNNQTIKTQKTQEDVVVYYFHATRRCATCKAVENVTKEVLKQSYKNKIVVFKSVNIEDKNNKVLVKKYKVKWQTLLIAGKDKAKNLTNFAFMNARNNPNKLKARIKSTIDSML